MTPEPPIVSSELSDYRIALGFQKIGHIHEACRRRISFRNRLVHSSDQYRRFMNIEKVRYTILHPRHDMHFDQRMD